MQAGIGNVVALAGGANSGDITDMLDHGCKGQRHDGDDGRRGKAAIELRPKECKYGVVPHDGQANPGSGCDAREIDLAQRSRNGITHRNAQQDRHDFDHAAAPDVADDDHCNSDNGDKPIGLAVGNGRACQDQTDRNDDRASHHRWEEAHDALGAKGAEQGRQHRIEQTGAGYAQAGVGQKLGLAVGRDGGITCDKGKRRPQECRHLTARQEVEQQRAQAGKQKRRRNRETGEHGHQHGGAKHGKQVL